MYFNRWAMLIMYTLFALGIPDDLNIYYTPNNDLCKSVLKLACHYQTGTCSYLWFDKIHKLL